MSHRTPVQRAAPWIIAVGLLVVAWVVTAVTPSADAREAPFPVPATIGEPSGGRNFAITITAVRATDGARSGSWRADGNWLLVDLEGVALRTAGTRWQSGAALRRATLSVGDRTYRASERPGKVRLSNGQPGSLLSAPFWVGLARQGSVAFELPADARTGPATLRLGIAADERFDSVIVLELDLGAAPREKDAALIETGWVMR